ncbi:MAG: VOC family protein [Ignavibacteriaceae bacterium]
MATVSIRYIVNNVDEAISFYTDKLGFALKMHPAPTFAMLDKGDLRLLLSAPGEQGGGGQILKDGRKPEPGGWNRISLQVSNLDAMIDTLKNKGAHFRTEIIYGVGGNQVLLEDPSGNPIELFQPLQQD